jgi:polysaccharide pyruvyl transferase WcaK-like protein
MAIDATEPKLHTSRDRAFRILIDHSEYWLRNNGDLAMLAVTLQRIKDRWPHARIGVLTDSPLLLRGYFPEAEAITVGAASPWATPTAAERLAGRVGAKVTGPPAIAWLRGKTWLFSKARGVRRRLRAAYAALRNAEPPTDATIPAKGFVYPGSAGAVRAASLVLALGGGYLTDADAKQTRRVLNLLGYARKHGVPVAMVGQGLGPLEDPELHARAADVLRHVQLIAMRERVKGPALLAKLGVSSDLTMVTGDDAIELAYGVRSATLGRNIGFCLRVARYSPISRRAVDTVKTVLCSFAQEMNAGLAPLIISEFKSQDRRSTLPLVEGFSNVIPPLGRFVHPREVAFRVSTCRIFVTGAYHLAVFALSQGIPVVALSSSAYYDDKFVGLGDMFGGLGLELIGLEDPHLEQRFDTAIRAAWSKAPQVRETLREQARAQIGASKKAYERVFELVESGLGTAHRAEDGQVTAVVGDLADM